MEENNQKEQQNKTPSKMARLAWPKAKYGVIIAIIIIDFKIYLPHLYHLIASDISCLVAKPSSNNKLRLY